MTHNNDRDGPSWAGCVSVGLYCILTLVWRIFSIALYPYSFIHSLTLPWQSCCTFVAQTKWIIRECRRINRWNWLCPIWPLCVCDNCCIYARLWLLIVWHVRHDWMCRKRKRQVGVVLGGIMFKWMRIEAWKRDTCVEKEVQRNTNELRGVQ